jgi:hypothetical protein
MDTKDMSMALLLSVRYALGRRTYIVSDVCDMVKRNAASLTVNDAAIMRRDISEEIRRADDCGRTVGDQCDHTRWVDLLAWMGGPG